MKHYAPNICLPLKITWKQDAKVRKGAQFSQIFIEICQVNPVIYTADTIRVPNIMILAQILLQIFFSFFLSVHTATPSLKDYEQVYIVHTGFAG